MTFNIILLKFSLLVRPRGCKQKKWINMVIQVLQASLPSPIWFCTVAMFHGSNNENILHKKKTYSHWKKNLWFLSCNMAAVQNLWSMGSFSCVPCKQIHLRVFWILLFTKKVKKNLITSFILYGRNENSKLLKGDSFLTL